jgi:hypothetical protein
MDKVQFFYAAIISITQQMHSLAQAVAIMGFASFFIHYFFMSAFMTAEPADIRPSLGKFYAASVMALLMVIIEIAMHHASHPYMSLWVYVAPAFIVVALVAAYRTQYGVGERQYLEEMIEHHSMAILTSQRILEKQPAAPVARIAAGILETQKKEIAAMRAILATS